MPQNPRHVGSLDKVYAFGDFTYAPRRGLARNGRAIPLEPRASALLAYLLTNVGRIVSKDELADHLWDGRATSDTAISTQVRTVRRALGDDRARQRFVRTHPKRGFEFVADVDVLPEDALPARGSGRAPRQGRRGVSAVGAAPLLLALIVGGTFTVSRFRDVPNETPVDAPPPFSLIVLPFDNLSGNPFRDYLADAFTENLITDLARIRDALIIARSTSFSYRGSTVDAPSVAEQVGVRYVLEGSLQIEQERVTVNAQLIDGRTNMHLWSDRLEAKLADLFSVQDSVTGRIASALRAELREADVRRRQPDTTADAWDLALRGHVLLYHSPSVTDYQRAHALFSQAIELDPTLASAWTGLGLVHYEASSGDIPGISTSDSGALALEAALRAAELDRRNAETYWLLGFIYVRNAEPGLAMAACERSLELNPNLDCGWVCAGLVHMAQGNPALAVPKIEYALRLNPLFRPASKHRYLGLAHVQSGNDEAAVEALSRALVGAPRDLRANLALTAALAHLGRTEEARAALSKTLSLSREGPKTIGDVRQALLWMGPRTERVLDGLRLAGMTEREETD